MKKWNKDTIGTVYPILKGVIYNIMMNRVLVSKIKIDVACDPDERDFWINISNNAIQMAALDWCKVFGSEDNEIYYTKYIEKESFLERLGLANFQEVSDDIRKFRNKYVAHCGLYKVPIPVFDDAIKVISAFQEEMEAEYDMEGYTLGSIDGLCKAYQMQIEDYLEQHNIDFK